MKNGCVAVCLLVFFGSNCSERPPHYCLEEADVLSEGSDASAERDEEHDHPHHDQDDSRVDEERVPHRVWGGEESPRSHVSLLLHPPSLRFLLLFENSVSAGSARTSIHLLRIVQNAGAESLG